MDKKYYTSIEIAEIANKDKATINRWVKNGLFPNVKKARKTVG